MTNLVKLNTNENPYAPSPRVLEAIRQETTEKLRLYPDPGSDQLRGAIARYHQIQPEQVFVGNGSDEVLAHVFLALLRHDQPILFPDITYSFYPVYCGLYDVAFQTVALAPDLSICADDYLQPTVQPNGGIIFPNPNAPTGRLLALGELERILIGNPDSVVVIDEAYVDFGGDDSPASIPSALPLIHRYPNLLVVQTLSKSRSLAGLRVGFAAGQRDLIEALERVKNSFNSYPLDRLAQAGAVAAYADDSYFQETRKAVMRSRSTLVAGMEKLGFEVIPSAANFIFARHPDYEAEKSAAVLRRDGIIVRHFKQERIKNYLRITIGTDEECTRLLAALTAMTAGRSDAIP